MAGSSFPSLNRLSLSMWARGSLGLGSLGVPSTRAQRPTVLPQPTMLCRTHVVAPWRTMLSRSRTPSPMVTPSPMETFSPLFPFSPPSALPLNWME
ncbi:hypothetical protein K5549_005749 [Capra hircus]|uniref:Uncharacterized protein n=1 Tax=Bos indicus x Bos taurus TaxID=30522 RepID=A0A4W2I6I6_BOBOX|nr:hypothetical protein K5549_005749 [Capra hircus]